MKIKRFKLNALSVDGLRQKEIKASRNRIYKLQVRYNEDYHKAIGWTSLEGRPTPGKVPFEPLEKG